MSLFNVYFNVIITCDQVPTGPRPTPEGEDMSTSDPLTLAHELVAKKAARDRGDTVVSFDTPAVRRGAVEMSDLAKSPLISGL